MRRQQPCSPLDGGQCEGIVQFLMLGDTTTSKFESKQKGGFGAGSH